MSDLEYLNKKWTWITPLMGWDCPPLHEPYTRDNGRVMSRLLRANAFSLKYPNTKEIELDSDIYVIISFDIKMLDKEIEFAKKLKGLGKKIVICMSADYRWLNGENLISPNGKLYTELAEYADVILSGVGDNIAVYGRYQYKVLSWGLPVERLNLSTQPFESRDIDILISSTFDLSQLALELESLLYLKSKYENLNIVFNYSISNKEVLENKIKYFENKGITFISGDLMDTMPRAKCYLNLEMRPRGGRAILEAFYCRTPFICFDTVFYSKLLPDFVLKSFNMENLLDNYNKLMETPYSNLIQTMELNMESFYFDNMIIKLMEKIYEKN